MTPFEATKNGSAEAASCTPVEKLAPMLNRLRSAYRTKPVWSLAERRDLLRKLRQSILTIRKDIEEAVNADFGNRSRHETSSMELLPVVQAIDYLSRNLRHFMRPERRHVAASYFFGHAYIMHQPKGVIGIIAPWNYPVALTLVPLATAIAAGNRAIIKPSELTPRTNAVLDRLLREVFAPDEVCLVVGGIDVGEAFTRLPFDHIFFTGSTTVGRKVMKAAAENLVPVTLELGGKSPAIIAKGSANSDAAGWIMFGKLANAGQTCVAPDYALVHETDLEEFIRQCDTCVQSSYPNGPLSKDYTSIISETHFNRLRLAISEASEAGASVIAIGTHPDHAGHRKATLAPTLVIGAPRHSMLMREEIFGPILPIVTYRDFDEAIDYVNAHDRPLALYYFGPDRAQRRRMLCQTTSGGVGINNTLMHVVQDDLPFGGVGASGMGAYHGVEGMKAMSHAKSIFVQNRLNLARFLRAPFGRWVDSSLSFLLRQGCLTTQSTRSAGEAKLGSTFE